MTKTEILDELKDIYDMLNTPNKKAKDDDFYPFVVGYAAGKIGNILRKEEKDDE